MNVIIETERLFIRSPQEGDAKPLNLAINESLPELTPWMPWASDPSIGPTEEFIRTGIEYWQDSQPKALPLLIVLKSTNQIIGSSGFNDLSDFTVPMMEIGYWISTKNSGNGFITEAVIAQARFAFEYYAAVRVQICMHPENTKSMNVAKRAGFTKEAVLKNVRLDCLTKKPCDSVVYACFDKDALPELTMFRVERKND